MPPKRKASTGAVAGKATKRTGSRTGSGVATPLSIGSSDDYSAEGEEASETEAENLYKAVKAFSAESLGSRNKAQGTQVNRDSKINGVSDLSYLDLKPDHANRPLWVDAKRARITLESFSPLATVSFTCCA
ncbi:MAG: hypothetical protein Q9187_001870 [Circinaria calcarea]